METWALGTIVMSIQDSKPGEKQISPTFSYFLINNALLYHFLANWLAHNKKMTEKSVFREAWSPELTSQSFPVPCFWCRGFVPHRNWKLTLLAHQNTGKENCYRIFFFATLISTLGRFNRANKKKSVIYTLRRKSAFPLLHYYCARFSFYVLAVFFNGCDWRTSFLVLPRYVKRIVSVTTQTLNNGFHWRISMP